MQDRASYKYSGLAELIQLDEEPSAEICHGSTSVLSQQTEGDAAGTAYGTEPCLHQHCCATEHGASL